jgi:hypothetical protein
METFSWAFRDDDPELRKFAERADLTELAKRVDPARLTELEAEYKVFFDLSSSILTLCIIIAEAMRPYIGADGYEKTRRVPGHFSLILNYSIPLSLSIIVPVARGRIVARKKLNSTGGVLLKIVG